MMHNDHDLVKTYAELGTPEDPGEYYDDRDGTGPFPLSAEMIRTVKQDGIAAWEFHGTDFGGVIVYEFVRGFSAAQLTQR